MNPFTSNFFSDGSLEYYNTDNFDGNIGFKLSYCSRCSGELYGNQKNNFRTLSFSSSAISESHNTKYV